MHNAKHVPPLPDILEYSGFCDDSNVSTVCIDGCVFIAGDSKSLPVADKKDTRVSVSIGLLLG